MPAPKRSSTLDVIRNTTPVLDSITSYNDTAFDESYVDEDETIRKIGYKSELRRSLNGFMNLSIGFTVVAVYQSIILTYSYSLAYGGPSMMLWSYIVNFICSIAIVLSLGELCSCYPTVGGVYHWSAEVVPKEYAPLCSYITGWLLFFGDTTGDSSFAYGCASFFSSALISSGYDGMSTHAKVGIAMFIIFSWTVCSMVKIDYFGIFCNFAAMFQYASLVLTIVALLTLASRYRSDVFVLSGYYNGSGGFPKSYVAILSVSNAAFSLVGYDSNAQMAEETGDSSRSAPRGMMYTVIISGILGLILMISLLYTTYDIERALNGPTGEPAAEIFLDVCGKKWGQMLTWLVAINLFFAGIIGVSVTSRVTYALARDAVLPFHEHLKYIHPKLKLPINAMLFTLFMNFLYLLLTTDGKEGYTIFTAIGDMCTLGLQLSYGFPILFKLIGGQKLPPSLFSLGQMSIPCNIISVIWLFGTSLLLFFPSDYPVQTHNMNWLPVTTTGLVFIGTLNWYFSGQYYFKGPKRMADTATLYESELAATDLQKEMNKKYRSSDDDSNSDASDVPSVSDTQSEVGNPPLLVKIERSKKNQDELIRAQLEHMSVNMRASQPSQAHDDGKDRNHDSDVTYSC